MSAPRRAARVGPHDVAVTQRADGALVLRSTEPLAPYARTLTDRLTRWARLRPDRIFLAERDGPDWRRIGYAAAHRAVRSLAQGLLDLGCGADRGLAILSGNAIDHALIALGAQLAGIPVVPVSPAYALRSTDFARLGHVLRAVRPAVVYVDDDATFARALQHEAVGTLPVVASRARRPATIPLARLLACAPGPQVDAHAARVGPDTVAKVLFTSGTTGDPKGVLVTQRMLCSNQQMNLQAFPCFADDLVMADWTPWSHTAGGNLVVGMVLHNGGTLFIDDGTPTAAGFDASLRTLREISPTAYFNVPRGYELLAPALAADAHLRRTFFRRLRVMWYGGAVLAPPVFDAMRRLGIETTGEEILMTSGFGSTETAPSLLFANWHGADSGNVGLPLPGVEIALVPAGAKLELRARGPNVTPGYLGDPERTAAAFDRDGFLATGDAVRAVDGRDVRHGLRFDGRIGDDFKLTTGTWVQTGPLRAAMIALLRPYVRDVVLCGADRDAVTMLMVGDGDADDAVRAAIRTRLAAYALAHPGSSTHVRRAVFLDPPPSLDAGEITDKGTLQQARVRERRRDLIALLDARVGDPAVIAID
jgi:feruloyl-CoA synthase